MVLIYPFIPGPEDHVTEKAIKHPVKNKYLFVHFHWYKQELFRF